MVSSLPILPLVFLLFTVSQAREILVGGSAHSWKVPENPNNTLNHWASNNRFKIGDILVWRYDPKIDSVLQVTREDFESCNTSKPIKEGKDGNTKVELDKSGPHFFISGAHGNCDKGEKMVVVVLSPNHPPPKPSGSTVSPAPAPPKNSAVGMVGRGYCFAGLVAAVMSLALA
ncbi:PREDICTED: early nodulin-like protein 1 [Tarenaya hassleriana]|uniref:early nodulin-like protein 1 n=1 Tax=Tarenaya hassleriana TaxID=28532 RepID=UPI00053C8C98|nr:PREDICTED: early nodulin-like protein 1 [Tarenaya hassleriana]